MGGPPQHNFCSPVSHGYSDVAMPRNYNRKHLERSPRTVGHETAWPLIALIGHAADSYWPFSTVLSQARRTRYRKEVVCDFFVRPSASRTAIKFTAEAAHCTVGNSGISDSVYSKRTKEYNEKRRSRDILNFYCTPMPRAQAPHIRLAHLARVSRCLHYRL